ncbi:MAG: hypothetical protein WC055_00675 [Melioribacteraceae bacterium]
MKLLDALMDATSMPIRLAVDVVKMPAKIMNGEDGLLENTMEGIEDIEDDLKNK